MSSIDSEIREQLEVIEKIRLSQLDDKGSYHSTDGRFISTNLTKTVAEGVVEPYGFLMKTGRFDIYCFARNWVVDRFIFSKFGRVLGIYASHALIINKMISAQDIRSLIEQYYDELFAAPGMFLFLLEEWLNNRGYEAKVIVNPGANIFIRAFSALDLKVARYGWHSLGFKVFGTRKDSNSNTEQ